MILFIAQFLPFALLAASLQTIAYLKLTTTRILYLFQIKYLTISLSSATPPLSLNPRYLKLLPLLLLLRDLRQIHVHRVLGCALEVLGGGIEF